MNTAKYVRENGTKKERRDTGVELWVVSNTSVAVHYILVGDKVEWQENGGNGIPHAMLCRISCAELRKQELIARGMEHVTR